MIIYFIFLLISCYVINAVHFNGGTITWSPVNPYDNSSSVVITITQSYSWSYPTIKCAINVPITTSGRSGQNDNLTCVVDCSTDGGYSTKPINILTDCTSSSTSLGMMTSQRSVNVTLLNGSHFSIAYQGAAWRALNYPQIYNLDWSILCSIDLRKRPDGFINTPPVSNVVSPQYVIVNKTTQIKIPVSDANQGDDVRCRWSVYQPGYRRRKRQNEYDGIMLQPIPHKIYEIITGNEEEYIHSRVKRAGASDTSTDTTAATTTDTTATVSTTTISTASTTTVTIATTSGVTTTSETPGTKKSTSSYIHRQAVDECGGICYPTSTPNDTTLSNCIITFTGLKAGAWYAVALQVEDFINSTSNDPMSSVPVQFLIYVLPTPKCSLLPTINPKIDCLDVQINVSISFDIYANNTCSPSISNITDIVVSVSISGMTVSSLTSSSTGLYAFITFTWIPQSNQIGSQQLCVIAYTSEYVQSQEYCVTFNVQTNPGCITTTSTSTSTTTTTKTTSSTSSSTTTTSISTSTSTASTSTTSTIDSSTETTSSTSTLSSSTETTSSTSTSSTTTTTLTSATSVTTTSATSTTSTSATTITVKTTKKTAKKEIDWLLILGISLLTLLMAICCCCCCLYYFLWGAGARRRRQKHKNEEEEQRKIEYFPLYDILKSQAASRLSTNMRDSQITLDKIFQNKKHIDVIRINNRDKPDEIGNPDIKPSNEEESLVEKKIDRRFSVIVTKVKKEDNIQQKDENSQIRFSTLTQDSSISIIKLPRNNNINDLTQTDEIVNSFKNNQDLTASISSVNVTKINMKAKRLTEFSLNQSTSQNHKINSDKNVIVTKIPRQSS